MARQARKLSDSGYIHVIVRGIGRQLLFETAEHMNGEGYCFHAAKAADLDNGKSVLAAEAGKYVDAQVICRASRLTVIGTGVIRKIGHERGNAQGTVPCALSIE